MKAEFKPSYDKNRQILKEIIPLDSPFTAFIEPTRYCNFKCFYCLHSTLGKKDSAFVKTGYARKHLDFSLYQKMLADMSLFPKKLRRIVFSGLGEPLMNPEISDMISLAKSMNIAERLDIITNASLLTPKLTDKLIFAGTSRIQISLQGLSGTKYREVCGVEVNFENLVENIKYLYENKGECKIFIKIIDAMIDNESEREKFFDFFGNICDQIFVEHLITLQHQMGDHNGKADNSRNLNNEEVEYREVCPVIFYMLQIDADGNVFPCPVSGLPKVLSMGNVYSESLFDIWNGNKRTNFILSHLSLNRKKIPTCSVCSALTCIIDPNEYLDDAVQDLIQHFDKQDKRII